MMFADSYARYLADNTNPTDVSLSGIAGRHNNGANITFVDGHVEYRKKDAIPRHTSSSALDEKQFWRGGVW
jgi:prepilin-type processing-associated H-X9-DG protein